MRLLDAAVATPWAIRPEALRAILAIAAREDISREAVARAMAHTPEAAAAKAQAVSPEAVSARQGRRLAKTKKVELRGSVAIVPVEGPIVRYAGIFDDVSGASSVQILAPDFTTALEDPSVTAIMLHVDSPGGEVNGIAEFGDMIYAARGKKPITAYVSDLGASAAYWLASAADRIVVAETAALGSIGVVMAVPDPSKDERGEIEFVSSQSPNKRPDPNSEAGREQYQALVDTIGDIFVAAVARNRDVTAETVANDFGAGGLLIGRAAVEAGLADAIGSYEQTVRELSEQAPTVAPAMLAPAASAGPARGGRMDRFGKFLAWLDGRDGDINSAGTDPTEGAMAESQPVQDRPAAQPSVAPATPAPVAATGDAEMRRLRDELVRATAENRRLRDERIASEAVAFADATIRDEKARPAEREAIVAAYGRAALDDATLADGADRVGTVKALYGVRPRGTLTTEQLNPVALQILKQRESTGADPNAPASEERLVKLLGQTGLGATVLAERNGKGS